MPRYLVGCCLQGSFFPLWSLEEFGNLAELDLPPGFTSH